MKAKCESVGCSNDAAFQCPSCLELGIKTYFCSKDCFRNSWPTHKLAHGPSPRQSSHQTKDLVDRPTQNYNPYPNYSYSGNLRPWPTSPRRYTTKTISKPDYADTGAPRSEIARKNETTIELVSLKDRETMRQAGKLAREVLNIGANLIAVGITTDEIDRVIHEACLERDCYPSPLNYRGFPKSCCTSINEVICHGIPDSRPLKDGDIINIDVTVYYKGFHADLNETFLVGNVDERGRQLVQVTRECLEKAIDLVKPGVAYRQIGDVIQKHADQNGFSVVRTYCGHGVGRLFHSSPLIPHYANNRAIGTMKTGHAFTIEPMISEGTWKDQLWPDGWTSVTTDGKRSAQFEHTILVTETGYEVVTK